MNPGEREPEGPTRYGVAVTVAPAAGGFEEAQAMAPQLLTMLPTMRLFPSQTC